jgi:putative transcriptional regulator
MSKKKQYRSAIMAAIHETAQDLHAAGTLNEKTLRKFDKACLTPVRNFTPAEIRAIREKEGASQPVFAMYLNVSAGIVSKWERGEKRPAGPSLKLLSLIEKKGLSAVA